jgi:glycosyltransferase involved in cell wall biosynthesis
VAKAVIRLYGVVKGNGSWARVTAGIRGALEEKGLLAGFYDLSRVDDDLDNGLGVGYDAPIGLMIGPPALSSLMVGHGDHRHRLLMIATNSSWLPAVVMERASESMTAFVGTSSWASEVISTYTSRPVYTWNHGVHPDFKVLPDVEPSADFSVLHLASTHQERKGTRELIQAWALVIKAWDGERSGRLRLMVDGPIGYFDDAIREATRSVPAARDTYEMVSRMDLTEAAMARFYQEHHLVCQPSRAEGFGLVPLEARACGVPVLATTCTGHRDHLRPGDFRGVLVVPHGEESAIDDGPGAMAPTVRAEDLADWLDGTLDVTDGLRRESREAAASVAKRWSWSSVTDEFLRRHGGELGIG